MQQPSDVAFQAPLSAFANGALDSLLKITSALDIMQDTKGKKALLPGQVEALDWLMNKQKKLLI